MSGEEANYVYRLLVPEKTQDGDGKDFTRDDFIGFIAYALYKHRKVRWINSYKNNNDLPDDEWVPKDETDRWQAQEVEHVNDYKELAENRFKEIMNQYVKDEIDKYKAEYKRKANNELEIAKKDFKENFVKEKIDDAVKLASIEISPTTFWDKHGLSIVHSAVGGIALTVISGLFLLGWIGLDLVDVVGNLPDLFKSLKELPELISKAMKPG